MASLWRGLLPRLGAACESLPAMVRLSPAERESAPSPGECASSRLSGDADAALRALKLDDAEAEADYTIKLDVFRAGAWQPVYAGPGAGCRVENLKPLTRYRVRCCVAAARAVREREIEGGDDDRRTNADV